MAEATRLATESVEKGWGGPFGAVIVKGRPDHRARAEPRAAHRLPVFHAEVTAIMDASARLNPSAARQRLFRRNDPGDDPA